MKLLVLGGTQFVGRHIVHAALSRGDDVTLFHRGRTNPGIFPEAMHIIGDRNAGFDLPPGLAWDAVIDVNGYIPRVVSDAARGAASRAKSYVFISTLSVYADATVSNQNEDSPVATPPDPSVEQVTMDTYGPLKVACERAAEAAMPGRTSIIRPGYIVGPWDHSGRFPYWVRRVSEGGEILAPGDPGDPIQVVDARDLAAFVLSVVQAERPGIYNAAGPKAPYTWGRFLQDCREVSGSDARFVWVGESFLDAQRLAPGQLPMWSGAGDHGLMRTDCRRAIAAGLAFRPIAETIRETLAWDREHGRRDMGLTRERELELLAAWAASQRPISPPT